MILSLFKKKSNAVERNAGSCICDPASAAPTESPFEEVKRLTGPHDHENVGLARCKACGGSALYYSADVYDDFWQHWCKINEEERAEVLEPDHPDDPQRPARARAILESRAHLVQGPVRGFEWAPPGCAVVQGPPW